MDKHIKMAKDNWEVLVLAATSLLAILSLAVFSLGGEEDENVVSKSKQKLERTRALSDRAFAFLSPRSVVCSRNPFELPAGMLEPPKPKHVEPPPKPKTDTPPVASTPPKPEPEPEPLPMPEPEKKESQPLIVPGTFEFVFQRVNNDGRTIAIVKAQPQEGGTQVFTVGVGETVMGVKVLSISDERIGLQDARGNRGTIPLGVKRRIMYLAESKLVTKEQ
ncbi:MAG: hypothetical protein IJS15_05120 [Victivallales bacterium]|nr:hypothetical protein [Victivallales bacterium]